MQIAFPSPLLWIYAYIWNRRTFHCVIRATFGANISTNVLPLARVDFAPVQRNIVRPYTRFVFHRIFVRLFDEFFPRPFLRAVYFFFYWLNRWARQQSFIVCSHIYASFCREYLPNALAYSHTYKWILCEVASGKKTHERTTRCSFQSFCARKFSSIWQ